MRQVPRPGYPRLIADQMMDKAKLGLGGRPPANPGAGWDEVLWLDYCPTLVGLRDPKPRRISCSRNPLKNWSPFPKSSYAKTTEGP